MAQETRVIADSVGIVNPALNHRSSGAPNNGPAVWSRGLASDRGTRFRKESDGGWRLVIDTGNETPAK